MSENNTMEEQNRNLIRCKGELHLGDFSIPCYVLDDGRRVLSGRGMQLALNMVDEDNRTSARLTRYLSQETLKPFIYRDKSIGHFEPLECYDGNSKINGYEASVLVDICDGILEARKHIELSPRQAIIRNPSVAAGWAYNCRRGHLRRLHQVCAYRPRQAAQG